MIWTIGKLNLNESYGQNILQWKKSFKEMEYKLRYKIDHQIVVIWFFFRYTHLSKFNDSKLDIL